ncbi:MAG: hypothetical protein D6781_04545 [Verrucomicrobia bacterium]|nr:MAG: hypothetical protein D6781_04545 [Verrucomicrobiota bacterium]
MDNLDHIPPGDRLFALESLKHSIGWALYLAELQRRIRSIEERALDPETDDETTRVLKHARRFLAKDHTPSKIIDQLITAARNEARREPSLSR